MKIRYCTSACPYLRSFRYGFDGSTIAAPYNGTDQRAFCVHRPGVVIHMRSQPACFTEKDRP